MEESFKLSFRAWVTEHPPELVLDLLGILEVVSFGGFAELFVRDGIPDCEGEVGGGAVLVWFSFLISIERGVEEVR